MGKDGLIFCDEYAQLTGSRIAYGGCYDRNDSPADYCNNYHQEDADFCRRICNNYKDVVTKGEYCDNIIRCEGSPITPFCIDKETFCDLNKDPLRLDYCLSDRQLCQKQINRSRCGIITTKDRIPSSVQASEFKGYLKVYLTVETDLKPQDVRIEMSSGGNTANVDYVAFRYMYPGTNEYLFEVLSEGKPEGENFFVCAYPQVSNVWACATKFNSEKDQPEYVHLNLFNDKS